MKVFNKVLVVMVALSCFGSASWACGEQSTRRVKVLPAVDTSTSTQTQGAGSAAGGTSSGTTSSGDSQKK